MRLIHTADWHLGLSFYGLPRETEHITFLNWLIERAEQEQADALIMAGDVFDSAMPSAATMRLWYDFVARLHERCPRLDLIAVAGNHDSPSKLEMAEPLQRRFRLHAVGRLPRCQDESRKLDAPRLVVPLTGADGRVEAWCLAIPFLRPADFLPGDTAQLHGVRQVYDEAVALAESRRDKGQVLIATGHLHLQGATATPDSERIVPEFGATTWDSTLFPSEIDYVALGHLHRAQWYPRDSSTPRIRYCGSPFSLSMMEAGYFHSVTVVEISGGRVVDQREIPTPQGVPLVRIPELGAVSVDEALERLEKLEVDSSLPLERQPFVAVHVAVTGPTPNLRARIQQGAAAKKVRLVAIQVAPVAGEPEPPLDTLTLRHLDPVEVFRRKYVTDFPAVGSTEPPPQLKQAFIHLLDSVRQAAQPQSPHEAE